jgi:hypothetical protein
MNDRCGKSEKKKNNRNIKGRRKENVRKKEETRAKDEKGEVRRERGKHLPTSLNNHTICSRKSHQGNTKSLPFLFYFFIFFLFFEKHKISTKREGRASL